MHFLRKHRYPFPTTPWTKSSIFLQIVIFPRKLQFSYKMQLSFHFPTNCNFPTHFPTVFYVKIEAFLVCSCVVRFGAGQDLSSTAFPIPMCWHLALGSFLFLVFKKDRKRHICSRTGVYGWEEAPVFKEGSVQANKNKFTCNSLQQNTQDCPNYKNTWFPIRNLHLW